jgi:hypothetical protein
MSWCDRLASTPTAGFKLTNHFAPIDILLGSFSPILDRVPEEQTKNATVEQTNTNFSIAFTMHDGFKYTASETLVSVAFAHRMRFRHTSGGEPVKRVRVTLGVAAQPSGSLPRGRFQMLLHKNDFEVPLKSRQLLFNSYTARTRLTSYVGSKCPRSGQESTVHCKHIVLYPN